MDIKDLIKVLDVVKIQNKINQQTQMYGQHDLFLDIELRKGFNSLSNDEMDLFLDIMLKQQVDGEVRI